MTVRVRFFAIVRDKAGQSTLSLDLPPGTSVKGAMSALVAKFPAIEPHLTRSAFAVNQAYVPVESPLRDGDELAVIPPVSGG